ncbi:MAG TPA: sugar transferase [Gaiellaceae bacterium]|nr:sugar transferase [Gaiellaceae bacterium]
MKATEELALRDGLVLHDELTQRLDHRTLEILDRRRKTATIRRRGWLTRRFLAASDAVGLGVAMATVQVVFGSSGTTDRLQSTAEIGVFAAVLPLWLLAAKVYGLYDHDEQRTDHTTADDFVSVVHIVTLGTWTVFVVSSLSGIAHPDLRKTVVFWALAIALITFGRVVTRAYCRRRIAFQQNAVIVGAGDVGQLLARKLLDHPEYGINLVGFLDAEPKDMAEDLEHVRVLGPPDRLPAVVRLLDVERVLIAFSAASHEETLAVIRRLKDLDVQIDIVPRLFEITGPNVGVHVVGGLPLMGLPALHLSTSSLAIKRMFDVVVSGLGLIALAPFFAYIAVRVKLDSRGPVFYRHKRVGPRGRVIRVLKFRTMRTADGGGPGKSGDELLADLLADPQRRAEFAATQKFENDPRITRYGRILRRRSIDELPQLVNVFRGDLSLVGPRPVTAEELFRYGEDSEALLNVRPGITGYWQVNGRSHLSYEERVRLDMAYVFSWSLRLDLMILSKTLRTVVAARGAY